MTELMYTGKSAGVVTWWGAVTGHQYKAGLDRQRLMVDNRDVDAALEKWRERDVKVFARAPARQPAKPAKLPPISEEAENSEIKASDTSPDLEDDGEAQAEIDNALSETVEQVTTQVDDTAIVATAAAQVYAADNGVDLAKVWTGKGITKRDVERWLRENSNSDTGNLPA